MQGTGGEIIREKSRDGGETLPRHFHLMAGFFAPNSFVPFVIFRGLRVPVPHHLTKRPGIFVPNDLSY